MSTLEHTWGQERLVATVYDFAVQNPVLGRAAALALWGLDIRRLLAHIDRLRQTPRGSRVLDVPCGGGLAFRALTPGHGLDYTAFDFSPVMLARARRKLAAMGLGGLDFRQGDVGAMPFGDADFDLLQTFNGIHCFPDPALAVREMARVLKPGGVLRGTLVVKGAGRRYDALIKVFQWRGWFGPTCSRVELEGWLAANGMTMREVSVSGAMVLFEAVKD
jgi:ubiquinone/menaquinone biosynthesis C-methylase UbiE